MKAAVIQQRSLLELAEIDAELSRIAHRAGHLPEQGQLERVQNDHRGANDRLAALRIALEDLDAQVAKFETEIDAVRQREDRDRSPRDRCSTAVLSVSDRSSRSPRRSTNAPRCNAFIAASA